jgi:rSAM/selenodomain-associated transferase 2
MPVLSVVVPVLNDRAAAERLLGQIPSGSDLELIVVDGGNDAQLEELVAIVAARGMAARYARGTPGRARQMNAGAALAKGRWLLFLHADSNMPPGWFEGFTSHTRNVGGGWFQFAIDHEAWQARMVEEGVRWRVRLLHLPFGDQGLFVRRDVFDRLDGFRDIPLMEDVDFVRRLVKETSVVEIPLPIGTSARRWLADGWIRRSTRNLILLTLFFLRVPPARLARWYG